MIFLNNAQECLFLYIKRIYDSKGTFVIKSKDILKDLSYLNIDENKIRNTMVKLRTAGLIKTQRQGMNGTEITVYSHTEYSTNEKDAFNKIKDLLKILGPDKLEDINKLVEINLENFEGN